MGENNGSIVGGAVTGALAGAAGVWLMDKVSTALYEREDPAAVEREEAVRIEGTDPTSVAVGRLAEATGAQLSTAEAKQAAMALHYALGIVPGAIYGVLRHRVGGADSGRGLLYGLALFVLNDEILGPALGLAAGPAAYPWQAHARGLAAHLVLGATTDTLLNVLDRLTKRR